MSELKAVVLCAGEGTRLRPLTFSKPKHLLPVAGVPLLGHVLRTLAEAGLREAALIVGHHAEAVQQYVGDGDLWEMDVTYITQQQPLGLAHAVGCARSFVGDDPFIVYLGDNLLEKGIGRFVDEFRSDGVQASLLLAEVEDPRRYGVAELDQQGRVRRLIEKPPDPPTNLAIVGVYAFDVSIFEAIGNIRPSERGELEITDAIQYLVDRGRTVTARVVEGFWEDAGEPLALLHANNLYLDRCQPEVYGSVGSECRLEGVLCVGTGTRITNSTVLGPCLIGRNCIIEGAAVGPYVSLGDGCVVQGSLLENCVIQHRCRISQVKGGLVRSVLGEDVQVIGGPSAAGPLHLILGDMAQIRMV